jgi:hypothetical protein
MGEMTVPGITVRGEGPWLVITLSGPIDLAEVRRGIDLLLASPEPPARLIVDVNDAQFVDVALESALLVDASARLHQLLTLVVVCQRPRLLHWFQSAAPQIRVVETVADALGASS